MTLVEKLAAKTAELEAATEMDDIKNIVSEIKDIKSQIAAADEKAAILESLKSDGETEKKSDSVKAKSLGDFAASLMKGVNVNSTKWEVSGAVKANTDIVSGYTTTTDSNMVVSGKSFRPTVRDLFANEYISSTSVQYLVEDAEMPEGNFALTAEGAQKPQLSIKYTPKTVTVEKIAGFLRVSDETIKDLPWLVSAINGRLQNKFDKDEEAYLVGKLDAAGIQTATYDATSSDRALAEAVLNAERMIREASDFDADAVIVSPADYQALRLAKDDAAQYYGGGYFTGAYGNGEYKENLPIWGMRTIVSSAVPTGTAYVGNFSTAAAVLHNGDRELEMNNKGDFDFEHNTATIRLEERLALAVYVPSAFVKLTAATAEEPEVDPEG